MNELLSESFHPRGIPSDLAKNLPEEVHANLVDEPDLLFGFAPASLIGAKAGT